MNDAAPDTAGELAGLLSALVAIPSLSGEEQAVQQAIAAWFTDNGMTATLEPAGGGLHNVVVEIAGAGPGPTLWIGGHCDTVSPAPDYSFDPHAPFVRDGRLYGVGAMDMKAGLACAMHAVRELHRCRSDWRGTVVFAALADEEAYSRGAKGFVARGRAIDAAIMCEPHFTGPSIGAIGKVNLKVVVTGRSAHGSTPHLGVNAVVEAGRLLAAIAGIERRPHPEYGAASHCVLNISSGERRYEIRVPDHCEFLVNWHFMPGETAEQAVALLTGLVGDLQSPASFAITIEPPRYDSFELPQHHPFVAAFAQSYAAVHGGPPSYEFCFGVSDANIFNANGIPTLLYGPGGANMHAADEWADLDQMLIARTVYLDLARRFLSTADTRTAR